MIGVYQQEGLNFFNLVEKVLKKYLRLESVDTGYLTVPPDSYDPSRKQYDSNAIIKGLVKKSNKKCNLKIGIVDVDIYVHGMNFIFGMAHPLKKTAIVSVYRLGGNKLTERICKEVVHEVGHLTGLGHCSDSHCVMYFSNTIIDTDNKGVDFCKNCRAEIG